MKVKINKNGRILIPKIFRKELDIKENQEIDIDIISDSIIIKNPNYSSLKNRIEQERDNLLTHSKEELIDYFMKLI